MAIPAKDFKIYDHCLKALKAEVCGVYAESVAKKLSASGIATETGHVHNTMRRSKRDWTILDAVARHFGVDLEQIKSTYKPKEEATAS